MLHAFSRTELLLGKEAMEKLYKSKVAIFGIGGVGSFVVEGLVRSGIGKFILVDDDSVCLTNLNRQLHATRKTVGRAKVEVMKERILEINPRAEVKVHQTFFLPETSEEIIDDDCDYIVDAIDTVTGKIELVLQAKRKNIPVISCLGAGNKLDPTKFEVDDIYNTSICPLAKVMRRELRKRGIESLKVVYSKEVPIKPKEEEVMTCREGCICSNKERTCLEKRQIPGSVSFVPSVAGLIIAGEVVKDLISR
ncbi:MAG TPA: tRNA threonylcarbamoyladenosine dehydratase [Defluviitaleaceae bacterium]|jgi:tRNA A37 threonylcarbamoyladenosine dehydratase|nr:tRNA threonylcarbamoyladenosine dehydratase [Candidatus Epulonipiscium sp.]HOQ16092.1 tRNA threonylcarbamoyladenosine dehydratase [Defluviitaleaceae bacterium]HPT75816.1 tRNA threonylcarbamoyladenosine dehydratase [Defluviitaleaceae bacterium]HQD51148.1 tRNA threonylcarbamoyladenosine dehydratase [Defluviitaleaceae bacterium]